MKFQWKIQAVEADGELITSAKYYVLATDGDFSVDTEGRWFFIEPKLIVPFADVTEDMICGWIQNEAVRDGKPMIESRLKEQISALKTQQIVNVPWMPQTFTPEL